MKMWKDSHPKERQAPMMKASDQGSNVRRASMLLASKIHFQGEFACCIHIYVVELKIDTTIFEKPSLPHFIFESQDGDGLALLLKKVLLFVIEN